jgi:O-antigen ligase
LRGLSWAVYALIACTVGRVLDIVPVLSSLPLVKVLLVYLAFALIAHRKLLPKLITPDNPAVKWAMALAVWIVLSFAFSIWLGPSRDFILITLPVLCAIVLVICKFSGDWKSLRSLFLALFVAAMILAVPGLLAYGGGRLAVRSMYDTNDLAYVLDGVFPTALAFGMTAASRTRRLLFYGSAAIMVVSVLLTASRGGMFGLLFVMALILLDPGTLRPQQATTKFATARKTKMGAKTRIVFSLVACVSIGIAVWPKLPPETRERLATMLNLGSDYNVDENGGRLDIWKRGVEALADRPIGYGINTFPMVDVRHGGRFQTAHNSLLLVFVELGPIGLAMYLGVLLHVWRGLTKIRRTLGRLEAPSEQQRQQAVFCRMSQASLVANFIAGQFLSATFVYAHWVNIALAMAFIALLNREKLEPIVERKIVFGR